MGVALFAKTVSSFQAVSGVAVSSRGKRLHAISVLNADASVRYLQLFDSAAVPKASDVPFAQWVIPPQVTSVPGQLIVGGAVIADDGIIFDGAIILNGIAWGISTSRGSYTAATASEHDVTMTVSA